MKKQTNISTLEPTRVEANLVAAMREHRDEWPYIYVQMKAVCEDDLLLDADYCNRHKHPSMTQFYRECGEICGVNLPRLRKYQRAGGYYEACMRRFGDLPTITDERVCALSPETLIYVQRIEELIAAGDSGDKVSRDELIHTLIADLLEGKGLSRKQLVNWLSSLQTVEDAGELASCVDNFVAELNHKMSSGQAYFAAMRSRRIETQVMPFIQEGLWLTALGTSAVNASIKISVLNDIRLLDGKNAPVVDFAVMENATCKLAVHAIEIKAMTQDGAFDTSRKTLSGGFDYSWIVFDATHNPVIDTRSIRSVDDSIGVMEYRAGVLKVIRPAVRLNPSDTDKARLYGEMMARMLARGSSNDPGVSYGWISF